MKNKVYLVEYVNYDDYSCYGIFSTRRRAEKLLELCNRNVHTDCKCCISEMELDPEVPDIPNDFKYFNVFISKENPKFNQARLVAFIGELYPKKETTVGTYLCLWAKNENDALEKAKEIIKNEKTLSP